jgi:FkbM family methyltransferase
VSAEQRRAVAGVVAALAWASRALPAVRGKYYVARRLTAKALALGVDPLVTTTMHAGHELRLDLRSGTEFFAYWSGTYDDGFVRLLCELIPPGCTVLDIGAHIGFYAVPLAKAARKCGSVVTAAEPVPMNRVRLDDNLRRNELLDVVRVEPVGLSDYDGSARISLREDFLAGSSTGNAAMVEEAHRFPSLPIEVRRLDGLREVSLRPVGLIKVDIEGHEPYFLRGARETLTRDRPLLFLEVNKPFLRRHTPEVGAAFAGLLPDGYRMLRPLHRSARQWRPVVTLDDCKTIDNVLVYPGESAEQVERHLNIVR